MPSSKHKAIIFKEAALAHENATQEQVMDSENLTGCMRIVVAYHLSTACQRDRIVVLGESPADKGANREPMDCVGLFASSTYGSDSRMR